MFSESIKRLQQVKRYVSEKLVNELADEPGISNYLEDITYQLSMIQEQLSKVNKIMKGRQNENCEKNN